MFVVVVWGNLVFDRWRKVSETTYEPSSMKSHYNRMLSWLGIFRNCDEGIDILVVDSFIGHF